ncbi:MAG: type II toxin-antitoxin system mRNA interferase toxin, RelE/StbE family [Nanoarchaeota archaeon]|nr:type II toxin-antitoxin system mRNA interferase toxin, RelE/StbE family [Nanoarchaeota archaeon]
MYKIFTANSKTEKRLKNYLHAKKDIKDKLERLKINPRKELGAHPLHGRLKGKWGCWLGSNIRMIYSIDDINYRIIVEAVGSHKIY